jgi:hypothetical protein
MSEAMIFDERLQADSNGKSRRTIDSIDLADFL